MNDSIVAELRSSADTISKIDPAQLRKAADIIRDSLKAGGQVIFMGNGGSSADAQHIAAEFSGRYMMERPALPGVCLSNIAPVTAIGNDYAYDLVFKRQIEAFCRKGDVVVGLSTSGNSKNVILAMERAKELCATTISYTGDGGRMREIADHAVVIPSKETPRIQEAYLCANHIVCGIVEKELFGEKAVMVDRDDTLAPNVPYCDDPDKFNVFPDVPAAVARLNDAGYRVIVVTNQSGIGRGYFDESVLKSIHDKMLSQIEAGGGYIDDIFYCPHKPDDGCSCRKPEIGLGLRAVSKYNIDVSRSFMVGDADIDMEFGKRMGLRTVRVGPDRSFSQAVDIILNE